MIDLVTMKEIWSFEVNDKIFYDNLRIIGIWFALGPKKLGLGAFNKMIY